MVGEQRDLKPPPPLTPPTPPLQSWEVPEGTPGSEASTYFKMKTDIVPGAALEAGPWTKDKLSPEDFSKKQTAELNNGR